MRIAKIYEELVQKLKDLDFLDQESNFIKQLANNYLDSSDQSNHEKVSDLKEQLDQLRSDIDEVTIDIIVGCHKSIEFTIRDLMNDNWMEIYEEQLILQNRCNELFFGIQRFKKELFQASGRLVEE